MRIGFSQVLPILKLSINTVVTHYKIIKSYKAGSTYFYFSLNGLKMNLSSEHKACSSEGVYFFNPEEVIRKLISLVIKNMLGRTFEFLKKNQYINGSERKENYHSHLITKNCKNIYFCYRLSLFHTHSLSLTHTNTYTHTTAIWNAWGWSQDLSLIQRESRERHLRVKGAANKFNKYWLHCLLQSTGIYSPAPLKEFFSYGPFWGLLSPRTSAINLWSCICTLKKSGAFILMLHW